MISGPWSLYDPVFGRSAIDFGRMRSQVLAAGDAILALDGLPREQISGDYTLLPAAARAGGADLPAGAIPAVRAGSGWVMLRCCSAPAIAYSRSVRRGARPARGLRRRRGRGDAAVTQPPQPKHGPGGSDYTHRGVRVSSGGTGADAWYVFEPVKPRPKKAPLAIVMHGYGEYSGYDSMSALIEHTVRKGSIAIYPRWQTGIATPCPGPFNIEPCITSAVNGINGALDVPALGPEAGPAATAEDELLRLLVRRDRHGEHDQPLPGARLAEAAGDLPRRPARRRAQAGLDEPALDDSLAGIPPSAKLECHSGADGAIVRAGQGGLAAAMQCSRSSASIPDKNKDLVLTQTDDHGQPTLSSAHGVCAGGRNSARPTPTTGTSAGRSGTRCAAARLDGEDCHYALGDTPQHRSLGRLERRGPGHPAEGPGRGADRAIGGER